VGKSPLDVNYVRINGINIRYIDQNQNREPVLFIHGLGGSIESWNYNIGPMSSRNLRIVALDLPGFGLSDSPKIKYSTNFYSDCVAKFLQTIGLDRDISIISSLGGQIGAEMAIKNNVPVTKLVLISAAGVPPKSFKGTPSLHRYLSILQAKSFEEVKNICRRWLMGPLKTLMRRLFLKDCQGQERKKPLCLP
jgi:2-hydroxy-6-oxonona-2,4-dienedioate hydrolase